MPKTLSEQQREWLDAALRSKGRFTLAKSVRKEWDDYVRRRDKAALGGAGLLADDPKKTLVDDGLKRADELAKAGKFSDAYKSLDAIKKIGAAASVDRARVVSVDDLRVRLNVFRSGLDEVTGLCDFAERHYTPLFDRMATIEAAADKATLREATLRLKDFATEEPVLVAELKGREGWVDKAAVAVRKAGLVAALDGIDRDIAVHVGAGHKDQVQAHADRSAGFRQTMTAKTFYTYADASIDLIRAMRARFDTEIRRIRDIGRFRPDDNSSVTPDDKTTTARKDLEGTPEFAWVEDDAAERLSKNKRLMAIAGYRDVQLTANTQDPAVRRSPELKAFDPDVVFDDVLADIFANGAVPDDIPFVQAEELIGKARDKLRDILVRIDPDSDEVFDLMLANEETLARMCNRAMTGIDSPDGITQSHKAMLPKMAAEMRQEILASSPNRMKDDASEITVNGKSYGLVGVIGEGANGAVRRYTDGEKTFVVKSLKSAKGSDESFDAMAGEMRTHRQLMTGADDGVSDASNIVRMDGAAVSNDGSLHMMMEEAEGGDLGAVGNNLVMLQGMGVIPDEARKVLALDMIAQTVKGMKAMQERGLVQNDLKPQNLMLNKDGTVKIIDFGESRFVDQGTGTIQNAPKAGYNTTPGFEAPEHYGRGAVVDSKADTYALGGIIKTMLNPSMSEGATATNLEPVTAMGRLTKGLTDQDPAKRPSLDAVLMSSLLDQTAGDYNPEDVKDLQKASAATNVALKGVKATISAEDLQKNSPTGKGYVDAMWVPYLAKGQKDGAEVPIAAFNTMVVKLEDYIRDTGEKMRTQSPGEAMDHRANIEKAKVQRAFWMAEVNRQMADARAEGKREIEAVVNDEGKEMQVPGPEGGYLLLSDAVRLRDRRIAEIPKLQQAFYALALTDPDRAQALMDRSNALLVAMDLQIKAVNAEILRLVGPKGKYVLAEAELAKVAGRFGPGARAAAVPEEAAPDPLPPLPPEAQGVIPDAPPLPENKKKVAT